MYPKHTHSKTGYREGKIMGLQTIIERGREIIQEMEDLTRQTPPPVSKMEALSAEWRGYCRNLIDLAQAEPLERRNEILNFFLDVGTALDLPIIYATKWKRRKK